MFDLITNVQRERSLIKYVGTFCCPLRGVWNGSTRVEHMDYGALVNESLEIHGAETVCTCMEPS